jgi:hypothetical protein
MCRDLVRRRHRTFLSKRVSALGFGAATIFGFTTVIIPLMSLAQYLKSRNNSKKKLAQQIEVIFTTKKKI